MNTHNLTVAGFATILAVFVVVDALGRRPNSRIRRCPTCWRT
jgi:hypothetical protein